MGIFLEQVVLVNRAPVDLTVRFDGQDKTLKPGDNIVPAIVVDFAKNQNPIMGSADPNNPHISGGRYLVGVKDVPFEETEPLTEEEWNAHLGEPQRNNSQEAFNEMYGSDPKAKLVLRGKGRRSTANSRNEAGVGSGPANATFSAKD